MCKCGLTTFRTSKTLLALVAGNELASKARFPLPELTTRAVNSGRQLWYGNRALVCQVSEIKSTMDAELCSTLGERRTAPRTAPRRAGGGCGRGSPLPQFYMPNRAFLGIFVR